MIDVVVSIVGILGVILITCGISWMLEVICDGEDYRHKVTVEDLAELSRLFDDETSFVSYNDKGEKFLCGYKK